MPPATKLETIIRLALTIGTFSMILAPEQVQVKLLAKTFTNMSSAFLLVEVMNLLVETDPGNI